MLLQDDSVGLFPFEISESNKYWNWVNEEKFASLLGRSLPVTKLEHENWYENIVQASNSVVFAVKTLDDQSYLGNVWLHNIHWINGNGELRILLGADQSQGKGYGSKACRLLVKFAFEKLRLHKVYLYVSAANPRAAKAFEKAGFVEEGLLKQEFFIDGQHVDVKRMAIVNAP